MRVWRLGVLMIGLPLAAKAGTVHSLMELARQQVGQSEPHEARLEGNQADHFLKLTHGRGPVNIQTFLIRPINPECSQIRTRVLVQQVPRRDGLTGDFWMDFQISLCRDGNPP